MAKPSNSKQKLKLPPIHDWRTTDTDEINKRRQRAREETFAITNTDPQHFIFSNFRVKSASGLTYAVEIRSLDTHQSVCDCVDFRTNGLAFCKHVEAVRLHISKGGTASSSKPPKWQTPIGLMCWLTRWRTRLCTPKNKARVAAHVHRMV